MTHSLRAKLGIFLERKKNVDRKSVREFSFCLGETGDRSVSYPFFSGYGRDEAFPQDTDLSPVPLI